MSQEEKMVMQDNDKKQKASKRENLTEEELKNIQKKEKEQRAAKRANMSEEERKLMQEKGKQQKAAKRASETEEERKLRQERDRERKREKAKSIKKQTYSENEREMNRLYKEKIRMNRSDEQIEFDKLEYVLRKRQFRKELSESEKEIDKEKSRIGMKDLRLEGPMMDYQKRTIREANNVTLWMTFWQKGQTYQDLLKKLKPDMVAKIKERMENEDLTNPEDPISDYDEQLNEWYDDANDIHDEEEESDLAELEISAYERIREENIKELEAAKKASGLFDD